MGKSKVNRKLFHSKLLVFSLIFSFILLLVTDASPRKGDFDSDKEFKPVVKVRETGDRISTAQKEHFERLIEEGKKLLLEDMDYEGALGKFNEAKNLAITREQKAGVLYYLSLAYFSSSRETRIEDCVEVLRKLIEIDYYRELDELLCPPRYIELFQGIKKEYGALKVQSRPAGADVFLNDSKDPVGKTPITIGSKAGVVKVRVKRGKKEKKDTFTVVAGKEIVSPIYILKGRSSLIYVIGGIVLAGGVGAALLSGGKGNGGGTPAPSPGPTTGSIQVNSTPTGAKVYLDGSDTGKTTNTTLTNISLGSHTVKLVKEGYVDTEETVSVTAGQTATVNKTLAKHTITVTSPTSSTIWTKGEEVEIKWETSGSVSFQGNFSTSAGLNPAFYQRKSVSPSFQNRAFRRRHSSRGLMKTRGKLGNSDISKNGEMFTNKSSRNQGVSRKFSSSGIINKSSSSARNDFPIASEISTQGITSLGKVKLLVITNVKIELYKGSTLKKTIASSTENDGSYTWTEVDESLADGTDYKVRISCISSSGIYGESSMFEILGYLGYGSIQVNSTPTGAGIYLDENYTGKTTNALLTNISVGIHTIKLIKAYCKHFEITVSVQENQRTSINAELEQTGNTISGIVYYSTTPLVGVTVKLHDRDASWQDPPLQTTTTDTRGYYIFSSVDPGGYMVRVSPPTDEYIEYGSWVDVEDFSYNTRDMYLPKKITLLYPANNETINSLHPTLSWTANSEAVDYTVQIYVASTWEEVEMVRDITSTYHTVVSELTSEVTYSWYVDAYNSSGHWVGANEFLFRFTVLTDISDGSGYPDGLKGDEITIGARILTVADAFDAMTTKCPYNKPVTIKKPLESANL